MMWFLAVFLLCVARIAVGEPENPSGLAEDVQCLAGTTWESYCNQCQCLENGIAKCEKLETCASSSIEPENPSVLAEDVQCLAGTTWESYCNQCQCLENGIAKCEKLEKCASSSIGEPITCKPNTIFKRGCNVCQCLVDGQISCTSNCLEENTVETVKKPKRTTEKYCAPGTKWTTPCSECICSEEGQPICTEMTCTGENNGEQAGLYRCAPESTWMNSCNQCYCTPNGLAMCTLMGCEEDAFDVEFHVEDNEEKKSSDIEPDNEIKVILLDDQHNLLKRSVCKPYKEFHMDCNACKCAADGQSFTCERNECMEADDIYINKDVEVFMNNEGVDHIERHSEYVCKPRTVFSIGCNSCLCNRDGSDYGCTNKPCPLPKDVEVFHELKVLRSLDKQANATKAVICSANRMFIKDCNTCWCNEDGTSYFCTRKVCVIETPEDDEEALEKDTSQVKQKCRPDEVFEMDCNMCRCNDDGTSFSCTRRACYPDDDLKKPSKSRKTRAATQEPKACQPGQEFRLDCNKCLCDNEGTNFSCTRIDCNGMNAINGGTRSKRDTTEVISKNCTAGSVFNEDCNVCSCEADGQKATCTTHSCDSEKHDNDINSPVADPDFRCNPGEQFKRDCNDCTCTADGKSVFCTLRMCPVYKP